MPLNLDPMLPAAGPSLDPMLPLRDGDPIPRATFDALVRLKVWVVDRSGSRRPGLIARDSPLHARGDGIRALVRIGRGRALFVPLDQLRFRRADPAEPPGPLYRPDGAAPPPTITVEPR